MKLVRWLILVAVMISPSHAQADDQAADDPLYEACIDASDGTNFAWAACGAERMQRAEARTRAVWHAIVLAWSAPGADADMVAEMRPELEAEQAAWEAYRKRACSLYHLRSAGREAQVLAAPQCMARLIDARTKYLEGAMRLLN